MELLDKYNELQQEIYDYFDFVEQWQVFPIDDRRQYWWKNDNDEVRFFNSKEAYESEDDGNSYSDEILKSRHHSKSVLKGADFTMIIVDTHTDGNKFLAIFDNKKQIV